jgi:uncharacterized protein YcfJ
MRNSRLANSFCLFATAATLLLPGCSTQGQRIGVDDGLDLCRRELVLLDSTGDYFAEDIVKGALIGAVGGGALGALAGGSSRDALIGALAGATAGAAAGYLKARQDQSRDQASLYLSVSNDIRRENASIDKTQLAFNQLLDCRQRSADRIKVDVRAGRLPRTVRQAQMADVRSRRDNDLLVARTISQRIQDRASNYEIAANQVAPAPVPGRSPQPIRQATSPQATTTPLQSASASDVRAATSTNLAKRDQFNRSIQTAQAQPSAFELS